MLYIIQFNQALYLAEHKARQAVETRANIQKELLVKQKEKMESDLRTLARIAKKKKEEWKIYIFMVYYIGTTGTLILFESNFTERAI